METASPKQAEAYRAAVHDGKSLFLTGSGGTGKTWTFNAILEAFDHKYGRHRVARTSSTGISATHIGGCTVYSFMGIGRGDKSAAFYTKRLTRQKERLATLQSTKVLLVDEVSQLRDHVIDLINLVLQYVHGNMLPFGGIQVLFSGDFFQLPPVITDKAATKLVWAFDSAAWREAKLLHIELDCNFRQNDAALLGLLERLRYGRVPDNAAAVLSQAYITSGVDEIEPTQLFCRNRDVNNVNEARLAALEGEPVTYNGILETPFDAQHAIEPLPRGLKWAQPGHNQAIAVEAAERFARDCRAAEALELKLHAQVLLTVNETTEYNLSGEKALVNGSRGVVVALTPEGPIVQFRRMKGPPLKVTVRPYTWVQEVSGKAAVAYRQLPLMLAYALTVHKAQGMTLDPVTVNLAGAFEFGQVYVAISRARNLRGGLEVLNFSPADVKAHPRVIEWYAKTFPRSRLSCFLRKMRRRGRQILAGTAGSRQMLGNTHGKRGPAEIETTGANPKRQAV